MSLALRYPPNSDVCDLSLYSFPGSKIYKKFMLILRHAETERNETDQNETGRNLLDSIAVTKNMYRYVFYFKFLSLSRNIMLKIKRNKYLNTRGTVPPFDSPLD
jgi:hypothetical protein